jgi:hypothetical protein
MGRPGSTHHDHCDQLTFQKAGAVETAWSAIDADAAGSSPEVRPWLHGHGRAHSPSATATVAAGVSDEATFRVLSPWVAPPNTIPNLLAATVLRPTQSIHWAPQPWGHGLNGVNHES